jgi:hypothetical protein
MIWGVHDILRLGDRRKSQGRWSKPGLPLPRHCAAWRDGRVTSWGALRDGGVKGGLARLHDRNEIVRSTNVVIFTHK